MPTPALSLVFGNLRYAALAAAVALATFALAMWLPNLPLLLSVFLDGGIALVAKFSLALSLLGSIATNYTAFSATYTVLIALLFGLYVALLAYYVRSRKRLAGGAGASGLFGMLAGGLGLGCAACKTLIITSLFAAAGGAGFLAALPLGGSEFGILGVVLLAYAVYALTKRIKEPLVCAPIETTP